jgi:hypothetical protein
MATDKKKPAGKGTKQYRKPRCDATTARLRVEDVLRVILDGGTPVDLRRYVAEQEAKGEPPWAIPPGHKPMAERQLYKYRAKAHELMAECYEKDTTRLVMTHYTRREALYARSLQTGDLRTAHAVLKDLAELQGLYPASRTQHEVTGKNGTPLQIDHAHTVAVLTGPEQLKEVRSLIAAAKRRPLLLEHTNAPEEEADQEAYPEEGTAPQDHQADGAGGVSADD